MKSNFGDRPRLHRDIIVIPFVRYKEIFNAFSDAIDLNSIDHLSVNIINPAGEIVCFSSTPLMNYYLFIGDLWTYDFAFHPKMYKNKDFYWWDECYDPKLNPVLFLRKQANYNFYNGFVIAKEVERFYILYSFASEDKDPENRQFIKKYRKIYESIGDQCYNKLRNLYSQYSGNFEPPKFKSKNSFNKMKNLEKSFTEKGLNYVQCVSVDEVEISAGEF